MFCHNIHSNFTKVQICPYSCRCGNARFLQYLLYHFHCKFVWCQLICLQIVRYVHKNLVNGINVYILRGNIFQIDIVNSCAVFHIQSHSRRCYDIFKRQFGLCLQLAVNIWAALQFGFIVPYLLTIIVSPLTIYGSNRLNYLKQSCSSRYSVSL